MTRRQAHHQNKPWLQGAFTALWILTLIGWLPVQAAVMPVETSMMPGGDPSGILIGKTGASSLGRHAQLTPRETLTTERVVAFRPPLAMMNPDQLDESRETCTSVSLPIVADAYMRMSNPTANYGNEDWDTMSMNPNSSDAKGGLFKWDLSSIPTNATVSSASLTFDVMGASSYAFGLYNLRRAWGEYTVTWNTYDGTNAWSTSGATNPELDRYWTNLWDAAPSAFGVTGVVTLELNIEGVAVVQSWVNGTLPNHGLTIQNYTEDQTSQWTVIAREYPSVNPGSTYEGARLNLTYCDPTATPQVTVTATTGQSKVYGEVDPIFSYVASDPAVIFSGALSRDGGENTGTYGITQGDLSATGYDIIFQSADFTITHRPIEVTADDLSKVVGDPDPALTYTLTAGNLVGTDEITGALERVSGETVGEYAINKGSLSVNDGNNGNNYDLAFIAGTLSIMDPQLPPDFPNTFHGEIHFIPGDDVPIEGTPISAFVAGVPAAIGVDTIFLYEGQLVYSMDVLADNPNTPDKDGAVTGDEITFVIAGRVVATALWSKGAVTTLHIHPPMASTGGPYVGLVNETINFSGTAQDWGDDVSNYAWDLDGDGLLDASVLSPSFTYATIGTHAVHLQITDAQGGQGMDSTSVIVMGLDGLSHAYDGTPKSVTVTGVDSPYTYEVTYQGSSDPPGAAGDYTVVVTVQEGGVHIGSVTRTMSIVNREITVTAEAKTKVYGDPDPDLTYIVTAGELAPGDSLGGALSRVSGEAVGEYQITQGGLTAGESYILTFVPANLTITPKPITIKADDHVKLVGDSDPNLTYAVTAGALAFDDGFTGTLTRTTGEEVGYYAIEKGSLAINDGTADQNYTLTFLPGTLTIAAVQLIELNAGWNLVSFNLQPLSTATRDVLTSIEGSYSIVYAWDATVPENNWIKYDPSAPEWAQSLLNLDETMGFWINMSSPATLTVQGMFPQSTNINLSSMGGGWNLVGFPSSVNVAPPAALEGHGFEIGGSYLIFTYLASDTADPWKVYDSSAAAYANDLELMKPGLGYWIYVTTDVIWDIDY